MWILIWETQFALLASTRIPYQVKLIKMLYLRHRMLVQYHAEMETCRRLSKFLFAVSTATANCRFLTCIYTDHASLACCVWAASRVIMPDVDESFCRERSQP